MSVQPAHRAPRVVVAVAMAVLAVLGLLPEGAQAATGPQVFNVGSAPFYGDLRNLTLNAAIVDFASTPSGTGYYELAADGGVFTFGDAQFYGSTGNIRLNQPLVAMSAQPGGYSFLARDGGVFTFGAASFHGSGVGSGKEHVDLAMNPTGGGYWLLATDGSVAAFGTTGVPSQPAASGLPAGGAAIGLAATPTGGGLWIAYSNGRVDQVGDAGDVGDGPAGFSPVDVTAAPDGSGLWLVDAAGRVEKLGAVTRTDDVPADRPVVAIAAHSSDGYWIATGGGGPGTISGRVVSDLGTAAADACLFLNESSFPSGRTAADGTFRITASDGSHVLKIGSCPGDDRWAAEYYRDARFSFQATRVEVTGGGDTSLPDIVIDRAGAITGVVRGQDGAPLQNACVQTTIGMQAFTTVTGYYRLAGLPGGNYVVGFSDCVRQTHLGEYYDDAPTFDRATSIPVAAGETRTGIDAQLTRGGAISGVVTTADAGSLPPSACVSMTNDAGLVRQTPITVTGFYRFQGLRNGTYKVHFNDCGLGFTSRNDYADEWWNDQPSADQATPIAVVAGEPEVTGVNATLARGGTVNGVVKAPNGTVASGQCVDVIQGSTEYRSFTSNTGFYQVKGLRPGSYRVRFAGCQPTITDYATEWWSDASTASASTPIDVGAGATVTGIDAQLSPAGFLEGQVTDEQGNPVLACVDVFDEVSPIGSGYRANFNGVTGTYRIKGLNTAGYYLRFRDCRSNNPDALATEWFQDAPTRGEADPVAAISGQTLSVPTAVLGPESGISGVVTDDDGRPIEGVCVRAFDGSGMDVLRNQTSISTSVTGFYRVPRLSPSSYKVFFDTSCWPDRFISEWWQDATTMSAATPVATTSGQFTPNVNAVLTVPGAPSAPATVTATAGRRSATVSWSGVSDQRGVITGYRITASPGGAVRTVAAAARSLVFDGLDAGQRYTFTVQASNAFGTGAGTSSNEVRVTGAPGAPGRPSASAGTTSVNLSWTAPDDNGEAITGYVITASDGAQLTVGNVTTATFNGRPAGLVSTYTVRAVNGAGAGPDSLSSDAVAALAAAVPTVPNPTEVTAGDDAPPPLPTGGEVVLSGSGFAAFQPGEVVINSTPRKLGSFITDATGSFTTVVTIPEGFELGAHTLVATAKGPDGALRSLSTPVVVTSSAPATGYRMVAADGGIFAFGDAPFAGSAGGSTLAKPFAAGASTPSGDGYWLVGSDGLVLTFGDANFHGGLAGTKLNQPIVGMAVTPTGKGYWLVATDGGIFAFGDAAFHGSTGDLRLNKPIVGMASTPTGKGYWLVASDGGIFAFGDAAFFGSTGDLRLNQPIVGMAASPTGRGYWLVASDGGIFSFGDAAFAGSTGDLRLNQPIVAMQATPTGEGYRLVAADGGIFTFGDATFLGSTGDLKLAKPILAIV